MTDQESQIEQMRIALNLCIEALSAARPCINVNESRLVNNGGGSMVFESIQQKLAAAEAAASAVLSQNNKTCHVLNQALTILIVECNRQARLGSTPTLGDMGRALLFLEAATEDWVSKLISDEKL